MRIKVTVIALVAAFMFTGCANTAPKTEQVKAEPTAAVAGLIKKI